MANLNITGNITASGVLNCGGGATLIVSNNTGWTESVAKTITIANASDYEGIFFAYRFNGSSGNFQCSRTIPVAILKAFAGNYINLGDNEAYVDYKVTYTSSSDTFTLTVNNHNKAYGMYCYGIKTSR